MDKTQFAVVQNATRAVAAEAVASCLSAELLDLIMLQPAEIQPLILASLAKRLNEANDHYKIVAFQGYPAEYSDLIAGEFQESFERLSNNIKTKLGIKT